MFWLFNHTPKSKPPEHIYTDIDCDGTEQCPVHNGTPCLSDEEYGKVNQMKLLQRLKNAADHVLNDAPKPLTAEDMINATIEKTSTAQHALTKLEAGETLEASDLKALQWAVGEVVSTVEFVVTHHNKTPVKAV